MLLPHMRRRFPLMDAMRGIAAVAIVAFHVATTYGVADEPSTLRVYTGRLNMSVWIFFVISAFLLYRPFAAARMNATPRPSVRGYAWNRALRIFPGYWAALVVFTIWLQVPVVFTTWGAPRLFLLIQNYWSSTFGQGLGQSWSLCVELAFYAFLAALATVLMLRRMRTTSSFELTIVALVAATGLTFR